MRATPLQLALSTAILANRGKIVQPRMARLVGDKPTLKEGPTEQIALQNPQDWETTISAMRDVIHSATGTAKGINHDLTYDIAGKTGTAQVVGIKQNESYDASKLKDWHKDHALFVGFAPVENPRIALAVLVENGGGGGSTAAPVGRLVFDAYFESIAQDHFSDNQPGATAP